MAGVWTNNWKGIKNAMLLGMASADYRSGWSTVLDLNGNSRGNYTVYQVVSPVGQYYNSNTGSGATGSYSPNRNAIVFGSGNGTPAASDYCLGAKWTSNISRVSLSESDSYDDTTHTKTKTVTCTVQNTGASAVTIREWGIEGYVGTPVLLYRALLDTPVTLQQYESATFTCTISMRLTDPI
jgi:hypothetical protein